VTAPRKKKRTRRRAAVSAKPVTAAELRALRRELERRLAPRRRNPRPAARNARGTGAPLRWNPDPEDVQKSVAQLVLTLVEFIRQLMERQAIRRMEEHTLTDREVEAVGLALMRLEETIRDIGARFGLSPEDLKLDLGPVKLM
jgi:gas vesicle protein GvpK